MQLTSGMRIKGHLTVRILDGRSGRERERIEISNTICEGAELAVERLFAQQAAVHFPEREKFWSIYAGTDNTLPAHGDTALGIPVFGKACNQPILVSVGGVAGLLNCVMLMEAGAGIAPYFNGNGNAFCEAGLYSRGTVDTTLIPPDLDAHLISRQIHSVINKDAAIAIEYTWRYQIAAS